MVLHLSRGVHYETFSDTSFAVFLPAVGETWRTWSERAQQTRQAASTAYSEKMDGSIPVRTTLREKPSFLAMQEARGVFIPLVNVLVSTEREWLEAREGAFAACGYATIDVSKGQPFTHPETIAGERGGLRQEFVQESDDPIKNLAARFNGTLRTSPGIMVSTNSRPTKRHRVNTASGRID